jgi:hypothetical protein
LSISKVPLIAIFATITGGIACYREPREIGDTTLLNRKTSSLNLAVLTLLTVLTLSATAWSVDEYPKLRGSMDPVLQKRLEAMIRGKSLQKAVAQERQAIVPID